MRAFEVVEPRQQAVAAPQVAPQPVLSVYWLAYGCKYLADDANNIADLQMVTPALQDVPEAFGFWAQFSEEQPDARALNCRFGSAVTNEHVAVPPVVQIALPLGAPGGFRGRTLRGQDGKLYLGHRGGLGGGGQGGVTINAFTNQMAIWGFHTEQADRGDGTIEEVFIVGGPHESSFLTKLAKYVNCCRVLRYMAAHGLLAVHAVG